LNTYTGWRLANKNEFQYMFGQYEISGDNMVVDQSCNYVSDDTYSASCRQDGDNGFVDNLFSQQFGETSSFQGSHQIATSFGFYDEAGTRRLGGVHSTNFEDDYESIHAYYNYPHSYSHYSHDPNVSVGQFLVRNAVVPEPPIIALFALGLVGIGFASRRQS
jgi:hypothetical protein